MDVTGKRVLLSFLNDFLKRSRDECCRRDPESLFYLHHWTDFYVEEEERKEAQAGLDILSSVLVLLLLLLCVDEEYLEAWKDTMLVLSERRKERRKARAVDAPRLYQKAPKIVNVKVSPRPIHQPR